MVKSANEIWNALMNQQQFKLNYDRYNHSLNDALVRLEEQPQDIQGRSKEIEMLYAILERPVTPVALLLGQAGVGKTAVVEQLGKELNSGDYDTDLNYEYVMISLRLGELSALGPSRLQSELSNLLSNIKKIETAAQEVLHDKNIRFVLFIDEVHMLVTIFGPGTKIGGDVFKDLLARSPIRIIAATTKREYDSTIAVDQPLKERFKQLEMTELSPDIVLKVCQNWWKKIAMKNGVTLPEIDESIIRRVIRANALYRSESAEPRKSLDILEDFYSYCVRKKKPVTNKIVDQIFKERYEIILKFDFDPKDVENELARRIKGQPYALYTLNRAVRAMKFQLNDRLNQPRLTMLFTGPTGSGKSESTKVLAETLYPEQPVLLNINMPDYKTAAMEPDFRKRLGEFVRHTPNAIVLLDEFEKAHSSILDSMLAILDEGIVTFDVENREGAKETDKTSLRNTIIIATTNAGQEVFNNDAKFSTRTMRNDDSSMNDDTKSEVDQLTRALIPFLQSAGFKPELLGRFKRIIPYRGLANSTFLDIAQNDLDELSEKLETIKGIKLEFNPPQNWPHLYHSYSTDIAAYVAFILAKANDPTQGGARSIRREIDSTIYDSVVESILAHPSSTRFKVQPSYDSRVYSQSAGFNDGGVIVEALN